MKKLILLCFIWCSGMMYSQEKNVEPKFKLEGDLVSVTTFYEDGTTKEEGYYKNKKPHGEWNMYDIKGVKIARGIYDEGEKVGKWMFLNNGFVTEVDYKANKITKVQEWKNRRNIVTN